MQLSKRRLRADYLVAALSAVFNRRTLPAILLLFLALIVSNVLVVFHPRIGGAPPSWPFIAGVVLRVMCLLVLPAAIIRTAVGSARHPYAPDGAFWLFALLFMLSLVPPGVVGIKLGDITSLQTGIAMVLTSILVASPMGAWVVAGLVERPLAWWPVPWFRRLRLWLPQRLFWSLLIIAPLGLVHGQLEGIQLAGPGPWFWPAAIVDGLASLLILMVGYGLNVVAYRRVVSG